MGCASVSGVPLQCRHQSIACALAMGEKYGMSNIGIATGQSLGDIHTQPYIVEGKEIKWIINDKNDCYIGKREGFIPDKYQTVNEFLATWW